jgi:Spy/CpxP family protein refolding chaperone
MKTVLSFFVTTLFAANSWSQTAAEVSCRGQAKEMAVQTYSSCITQARNQQVEQIRADYQKELTALKAKYDKELKGVPGSKGADSALTTAAAPKKTASKAAKSHKSVAKQLPAKTTVTAEALPIQTVQEGTKVVTVTGNDSGSDMIEKDSSNSVPSSDEVENSEVPAE